MWLLVFSLVSLSLCLGVLAGYLWGCRDGREDERMRQYRAYQHHVVYAGTEEGTTVSYAVEVGVN